MATISRNEYVGLYGPTTGDRIRLADTNLIIQVEHDATVYGDEAKFGGLRTTAILPRKMTASGSTRTAIHLALLLQLSSC